ncbi:MAG: PIN domain-containing protein [Desulfovermiculus sp.]
MSADVFLDTTILIYAYDSQAGSKHLVARDILRSCWHHQGAVISTQVLQEFYVNITRKIPQPLSFPTARRLVEQYRVWPVITNTTQDIIRASEIQERYQLSFWDSLIICAAVKGDANTILTEDLSHNQCIEGVRIQNPLLSTQ